MATGNVFTLDGTQWGENGLTPETVTAGAITYTRVGNGARRKWTNTAARRMSVAYYCESSSALKNDGRHGVIVDGVRLFGGAWQGAANNIWMTDFRLPRGSSKTVELVVPLASAIGAGLSPLGFYPYRVEFDAPATDGSYSLAAEHMVIYGDSIASGGVAIAPQLRGWAGNFKAGQFAGTVTLVAHGTRRLADDCDTPTKRAAFAAYLLALSPTRIVIAIGSNDHSVIPAVSVANVATYIAGLLDAIRALSSTVKIFVVSPIRRGAEGTNALGETMDQHRAAYATACTDRAGWANPPVYVDGKPIFTDLTLLPDQTHPGTAGALVMSNYLATPLAA